ACHLVNTAVFDYAPAIIQKIMARGDEIVGHGRTNAERLGQWWEADEARVLREIRDRIERDTGQAPCGWMGTWMSQSNVTTDLPKEAGFKSDLVWPGDDQLIWLRTRDGGRIMSIPYSLEVNDSPQMLVRHHSG